MLVPVAEHCSSVTTNLKRVELLPMGTFVAVTDTVAECERRCLLSFEPCFGFTFAHTAGQCLLHYEYILLCLVTFSVFLWFSIISGTHLPRNQMRRVSIRVC